MRDRSAASWRAFVQDARDQGQVVLGRPTRRPQPRAGAPLDAAQHLGRFRSKRVPPPRPDIREKHLQLTPERFGHRRLRLMLVEHAAAGRFEARGQGTAASATSASTTRPDVGGLNRGINV